MAIITRVFHVQLFYQEAVPRSGSDNVFYLHQQLSFTVLQVLIGI